MILKLIQSLEHQLLEAQKNSDVQALDALIHDHLMFVVPGGQVMTKKMDLDAHRSGSMKITSSSSRHQQIELIGDAAVVTVQVTLKGTYNGNPLDGTYTYLRVWKDMGDRYQIIGGSCSVVI